MEDMEIFALKGYKVRVTEKSKRNGNDYDIEKVKEHLTVGETYTVDYTNVHSSSTDVYLEEVPDVRFNSVNFEGVVFQPDELTKQHPDYKRYN